MRVDPNKWSQFTALRKQCRPDPVKGTVQCRKRLVNHELMTFYFNEYIP